jgi:glutathione synthase/RimK-type ligase-like ATP-grasp enzyme
MKKIIVTNQPYIFEREIDDVEIMKPRDYLTRPDLMKLRNTRVFNLCDDYRYQSKGYYVSLLAEARGHKPIPSVKHIQDLKAPKIVRVMSSDLDDLIQKSLKNIKRPEFTLSVYFGRNLAIQYEKLAAELHKIYQVPLLRARFSKKDEKWFVNSIKPISLNEIPEDHLWYVQQYAETYFKKKRYDQAKNVRYQYDLAILYNPEEKSPPSDKKALQKFIEAAERQNIYAELITKDDYDRLAEFNALFIRETTNVNHHTYRFASRAESEGLVVLDDPLSILKCTNKVYLAELLEQAKVPTPKTLTVHADNKKEVSKQLGLPCVLKLPDSSFSQGVVKVKTEEELSTQLKAMLNQSELVVAQEFLPTDFDWRVGVIDNKVLYACKYFMAKGHWQIYNWENKKKNDVSGGFETVPIAKAPKNVIEIALKATALIGNGLYGVDVKESEGKVYIIEVNDNPSLESGVEDKEVGDKLYDTIIETFKNRLESAV